MILQIRVFNLANKFENLVHRPIDLVAKKSLSNPYFIGSINQAKRLLNELTKRTDSSNPLVDTNSIR